jgi:hypothetical protein
MVKTSKTSVPEPQSRETFFCENLIGSLFFCEAIKCTPSTSDPNPNKSGSQNLTGTTRAPRSCLPSSDSHHASKAQNITNFDELLGKKSLKPLPHTDRAPQVPSWEREPEPLEGWTIDEQQALEAAARTYQRERTLMLGRGLTEENAHWQFLRLLARQVPGKSAKECERCLKHVEAKRIAYFGPPSRSASTSPLRTSRSPLRSSAPSSRRVSQTGSATSAEPPPPPPPPLPPPLPPRTGSAAGRAP